MAGILELTVDVEEQSGCKRKLRAEIPAEATNAEYEALVRKYARVVRLPGFRPGKAPAGIVKNRFKSELRDEVAHELMERAFQQIASERGLKPVAAPRVQSLEYEPGQPLRFELTFEVLPEFELGDLSGLAIAQEPVVVTDVEVDEALGQLRQKYATLLPQPERIAADGDFASISLEGTLLDEQGAARSTFRNQQLLVEVGGEATHEMFSAQLRGTRAGDLREFEIDYPQDYPEKELAGQKVRYNIQIENVLERKLPELDDEFARDVQEPSIGDSETLDQLRERIRARLQAVAEAEQERAARRQLIDQLTSRTELDVPDALIEQELDQRLEQIVYRMVREGFNPARANVDWSKVRSDLYPDAALAAKRGLILDKIAERAQLEVSREELDREVELMAQGADQPVEKFRAFFQQESKARSLRQDLRRRKSADWLYSQAKAEQATG